MDFDVSKDPDTLPLLLKELGKGTLVEAATTPPRRTIVIQSRLLIWEIKIQASTDPNDVNAFVSVQQLLHELYSGLQVQVTDRELNQSGKKEAVETAFQKRCEAIEQGSGAGASEIERIRRVDFLEGKHKFYGLTPVGNPEAGIYKFTVKK